MAAFKASGHALKVGLTPVAERGFKPSSGFFSRSGAGESRGGTAGASALSGATPSKGPRRARSSSSFEDDFSIGCIGRCVSTVSSSSGAAPQVNSKALSTARPLTAQMPTEASVTSPRVVGDAHLPRDGGASSSQPGGAQSLRHTETQLAAEVVPLAASLPAPLTPSIPDASASSAAATGLPMGALVSTRSPLPIEAPSVVPTSNTPQLRPANAAHASVPATASSKPSECSKFQDTRPEPQLQKLIRATERNLPNLGREKTPPRPTEAREMDKALELTASVNIQKASASEKAEVRGSGEGPAAKKLARKRSADASAMPAGSASKKQRVRGTKDHEDLQPGATVMIHSLAGMASLNGKTAVCEKWIRDKGRWAVRMEGDHEIHLKPENLSLDAQAAPDTSQVPSPAVLQEESRPPESSQTTAAKKPPVRAREAKKKILAEVNKEKERLNRSQQTKRAEPKVNKGKAGVSRLQQTKKTASEEPVSNLDAETKARPSDTPAAQLASLVPYGANFVRSNLKKNPKKGAATGVNAHSKHVAKYFGKNGKLKPKYARAPDPEGKAPRWAMGSAKQQRFRYLQQQKVAERCLQKAGDVQHVGQAFSSGMTPELLSELEAAASGEHGLGEIASARPPDAAVPESPSTETKLPIPDEARNSFEVQPELNPVAAAEEVPLPIQAQKVLELQHASNAAPDADSSLENQANPVSQDGGNVQASESVVEPQVAAVWHDNPDDYSPDDLKEVLHQNFNHDEFRPGQQEAVSSVLRGKKTLLLLSTGSGKSLCFQMPAFLLREEGFTLVISPLVSLMQDQLQRLPHCLRGALINSTQSRDQSRSVLRAVRARMIDVLFISPERLSMWAFDGVGLPPIALACVDEAHCVSEWSHDFRPDYLRLHEFLVDSLGVRRLMALTATATRPTIRSVCNILKMDVIVRADRSFVLQELLEEPTQPRVQRINLTMDAQCVTDEEAQFHETVKLLQAPEHAKKSVVIYVWRKFSADSIAKRLRTIIRGGASSYHGGMLPEARRKVQDAFMVGYTRVVVATMAFGMGIDKPDIRMVIHYNIPKSIENYIQETGRCSRDGLPGSCVSLINSRDYKAMRWLSSGSGGNSRQSGTIRRLLASLLGNGDGAKFLKRHILGKEALLELKDRGILPPSDTSWQPYFIAFEERDMAKHLSCEVDELHSVLAQFAYRAREHVMLYSKFPTKMKLRFFKTDPDELAKVDPLLRDILALAKQHGGVHSFDTAHALAAIGGRPSQLSNGLWNAQGDEFSLEKAEYGYMLAVLQPADESLKAQWVDNICGVNVQARQSKVEKLDAVYLALRQAADASTTAASTTAASMQPAADASQEMPQGLQADAVLNGLIDAYFTATENPSTVVAGDADVRNRLLRTALGEDYHAIRPPAPSFPAASGQTAANMRQSAGGRAVSSSGPDTGDKRAWEAYDAAEDRRRSERDAVYSVVVRLVMGADWPNLPSEDPDAVAHLVAQFLAGIGSQMMPAKKWYDHRCWGRFKEFNDFDDLTELVSNALARLSNLKAARKAASPSSTG